MPAKPFPDPKILKQKLKAHDGNLNFFQRRPRPALRICLKRAKTPGGKSKKRESKARTYGRSTTARRPKKQLIAKKEALEANPVIQSVREKIKAHQPIVEAKKKEVADTLAKVLQKIPALEQLMKNIRRPPNPKKTRKPKTPSSFA